MNTLWTITIYLLIAYSCMVTVLFVLMAIAAGYWHNRADEWEAELVIAKSALHIKENLK